MHHDHLISIRFLLFCIVNYLKVGKKLKAPEAKIMRMMTRLEGNKNTDCACKSVIFAPFKYYLTRKNIVDYGAVRKRICQTFKPILFYGNPRCFRGVVPAWHSWLDRNQCK